MASFYAELHVEGAAYRVVHCTFACHQAISLRGRAQAHVRFDPLQLVLDVPTGDALLAWAAAPHKPLSGEVVFYQLAQQVASETIAFEAGECVAYAEQFASGAAGDGAYVCHLTIAAPKFELRAGGPVGAAGMAAALATAQQAAGPSGASALAAIAMGGAEAAASAAVGGAGAAGIATAAAATLAQTPGEIAKAVNPLKGTTNCSQITEAVIARLRGTDPEAVAGDEPTRTLEEIEGLYGTKFEPLADFHAAFNTINASPEGTIGLIAMGPREVTADSMGHIVTIVNHQGKATIIEGQHWSGYAPVETITSPTRAVRRYGDTDTTEYAFTLVPPLVPPTA